MRLAIIIIVLLGISLVSLAHNLRLVYAEDDAGENPWDIIKKGDRLRVRIEIEPDDEAMKPFTQRDFELVVPESLQLALPEPLFGMSVVNTTPLKLTGDIQAKLNRYFRKEHNVDVRVHVSVELLKYKRSVWVSGEEVPLTGPTGICLLDALSKGKCNLEKVDLKRIAIIRQESPRVLYPLANVKSREDRIKTAKTTPLFPGDHVRVPRKQGFLPSVISGLLIGLVVSCLLAREQYHLSNLVVWQSTQQSKQSRYQLGWGVTMALSAIGGFVMYELYVGFLERGVITLGPIPYLPDKFKLPVGEYLASMYWGSYGGFVLLMFSNFFLTKIRQYF